MKQDQIKTQKRYKLHHKRVISTNSGQEDKVIYQMMQMKMSFGIKTQKQVVMDKTLVGTIIRLEIQELEVEKEFLLVKEEHNFDENKWLAKYAIFNLSLYIIL